jgi:hypothetical protein
MSVGLGLARLLALVGGVVGIYTILVGLALVVGAVIERVRYRSETTDRDGAPTGPGGGEPPGTSLEPRFRRTEEIFTDPTSGRRMRVWIDPSNGERRYIAED